MPNLPVPLWNLTDRTCPECGSTFRPSDYDFRPGAVRFMCPHCDQDYYGTDEHGHLVPRRFDCVSCAKPLNMNDMVLLPAEGVPDERTAQHELPWNHRARHGFWRAWGKTAWMSLFSPGDLIAGRSDADSVASAWGFFSITFGIVMLVGAALQTLFMGLLVVLMGNTAGGIGGAGVMLITQVAAFAFAFIMSYIFVAIWAAVTHVVLRITGSVAGTRRTTWHAMLYSGGTSILAVIPCLNNVVIIWWIVSAILMIKRGQDVSGWRASLAVLALPLVTLAAFIALYATIFAMIFSTGFAGATGVSELQRLSAAAQSRAVERGTGWDHTDHALLLVVEDRVRADDLVAANTPTWLNEIPLTDGSTLADFDPDLPDTRDALANAIPALPADVVAHRVGDYVFTWHGIDPANPPPGVWIIIEHNLSDVDLGAESMTAITADGSEISISSLMRAALLAEQNTRRADAGLPPIPDPTAVTQQEPATAGP